MTAAHWEHFPHEADIGVRGVGASLAEAFEQAGLALTAVVSDVESVVPRTEVQLELNAPDLELLFADWLNRLVYEMATRHMLFSRFEVAIEDNGLRAKAWGEALDRVKHCPAVEVKGATCTELSVQQNHGNWIAQCVVDV
jgi:SHS2 domain-containing protein